MIRARSTLALGLAALGFACGSTPKPKAPEMPAEPAAPSVEVLPSIDAKLPAIPARLTSTRSVVEIHSVQETNRGSVLHMMLRQLDQKAMGVVESYEQAATFVVAPVRDDSVLTVQPVIPGRPLTLAVQGDPKKKLIAYFFFTNPGQNWRVELPRPLPRRVAIKLGNDQVDSLQGAR